MNFIFFSFDRSGIWPTKYIEYLLGPVSGPRFA